MYYVGIVLYCFGLLLMFGGMYMLSFVVCVWWLMCNLVFVILFVLVLVLDFDDV